MTAPKPGDRVRVTFEAVVEKVYDDLVRVCTQATSCGAFGGSVPIESVEVLASPVYVNSDTTEYRPGDIVRAGTDRSSIVHVRTSRGTWIGSGTGLEYPHKDLAHVQHRLILLVRNGKPVPQ